MLQKSIEFLATPLTIASRKPSVKRHLSNDHEPILCQLTG